MFVFNLFSSVPTTLEFPASGGAQITQCNGAIVKPVYAVALSELVQNGPFQCIKQVVSMRQIDARLEPALLAVQRKVKSRTHSEPNCCYNREIEYMFKEPVELLGHAGIIRVALYYCSGL
jgi:hypothetical protein